MVRAVMMKDTGCKAMPPKPYQKVELHKTVKTDHTQKEASNFGTPQGGFGEQNVSNCSIPYGGGRSVTNVTINPAELQRGIAKQKEDFAKTIAENIEYQRVKRGQRIKRHRLPVEEEYIEDGDVILKRKSTITKRREN